METTLLEPTADEIAIQRTARGLLLRYGERAADIARGQARIAPGADEEQAWLAVAETIEQS